MMEEDVAMSYDTYQQNRDTFYGTCLIGTLPGERWEILGTLLE
jgi:hypothetical protein